MSDLGGGRATNGGARTGGPVPVTSSGGSSGIKPPTEIMRARYAREARRQEEQKAEEQRRLAEERRRSAERRGAPVSSTAPRFSQASSQYTPDMSTQQAGFEDSRRSAAGRVAGSDVLGDPTGRTSQDYQSSRIRGPSVSQQDQPRAAPTTSGATRRAQQSQSAPRQPTSSNPGAGSSQQQSDSGRGGASSFPHAFERWETLSSHWEGLTSYWLHRLESNTNEMRDTVPNAATLNRQITDLSAAGANLFHAVVELQRLRASSERKFQRWFFETRADGERNKEVQAQVENQLKAERSARDEITRQRAESSIQAENARRELEEIKRELMISKDEARRAWEELGRRNQESLETAQSLKDGRITLVSGVQVVPYFGGPSRSASASQRPETRDGPGQYGGSRMGGMQSPGDEQQYYQQDNSPTNTDPFMETGPRVYPMQEETAKQSLAAGTFQPSYRVEGTPTTTSTAQTVVPLTDPRAVAGDVGQMSPPEAERFYQHSPQETFLHSPQTSAQAQAGGSRQQPPVNREEVRSEVSYVDSENGTEYALDAGGNIQHDTEGRPIIFRRRGQSLDTEDDYDTEADIRREQELAEQYGSGMLPEAPSVPATASQAMATFTPTTTSGGQSLRPDYAGEGYGGYDTAQTRHHHPTRLSDVLEEEEERSSRRTGD